MSLWPYPSKANEVFVTHGDNAGRKNKTQNHRRDWEKRTSSKKWVRLCQREMCIEVFSKMKPDFLLSFLYGCSNFILSKKLSRWDTYIIAGSLKSAYWLLRGALNILSQEMLRPLWQFMISRPILSCSHWLEFAYTQNAAMMLFYNVTRQHLDYVHDAIFCIFEFLDHIKFCKVVLNTLSFKVNVEYSVHSAH